MNLGGKLNSFYGRLNGEVYKFICDNELGYTNDEKMRIYDAIIQRYPNAPTKPQVLEEFSKVKPIRGEEQKWYWKKCKS